MEQSNNLKWVTSAQALGDYNLMLSFNDGVNRVVNCKPLIDKYKVFTPLLDKSVFDKFSLDDWTVSWLNGTIDISPEYLYEEGKAVLRMFEESLKEYKLNSYAVSKQFLNLNNLGCIRK